jgi:hypothetical protein
MSSWIEGRGNSKKSYTQRSRSNGWYPGESSWGRTRGNREGQDCSVEKRELIKDPWQTRFALAANDACQNRGSSDAFVLEPQGPSFSHFQLANQTSLSRDSTPLMKEEP